MNVFRKILSGVFFCGLLCLCQFLYAEEPEMRVRFGGIEISPDSNFSPRDGALMQVSGFVFVGTFDAENVGVEIEKPEITAYIKDVRSGLPVVSLQESPVEGIQGMEISRVKQWAFVFSWDGKNDAENFVEPGRYVVTIEVLIHKKATVKPEKPGADAKEEITYKDARKNMNVTVFVE